MVRFWSLFIEPFIRTMQPGRVMEIGADRGWNTARLLAYCHETGCRADIVDPAPQPSLHEVLQQFPEEHAYHPLMSLKAIPLVPHPDLVLLDGDHNWHTVHAELMAMWNASQAAHQPFPCILAHDVAWPYGRRDMYYEPDQVPVKHPFAYQGLRPGNPGLVEDGMNNGFANARVEGGPRNGVLTAIEDFIEAAPFKLSLRVLPFFNGLGIVIPAERSTPELEALVESFFSAETLLAAAVVLEEHVNGLRASLAEANTRLDRRTVALQRAKDVLQRQEGEIATLRKKLAKAAAPPKAVA